MMQILIKYFIGKKGFKYFIDHKDGKKVMRNASKNECIQKRF